MNPNDLANFPPEQLERYVWDRLRGARNEAADPPLDHRMGLGPPEQFLICAANTSPDLRSRIINAVAANLRQLITDGACYPNGSSRDPIDDQQVASIAYLASMLHAHELAWALLCLALAWSAHMSYSPRRVTDGEFHVLRTIAQLQGPPVFESLWQHLRENGPRSLRGLVIHGWAGINPTEAIRHLGELLDTSEVANSHVVLKGLLDLKGCDANAMGSYAQALPKAKKQLLYSQLEEAGVTHDQLHTFLVAAAPPKMSHQAAP